MPGGGGDDPPDPGLRLRAVPVPCVTANREFNGGLPDEVGYARLFGVPFSCPDPRLVALSDLHATERRLAAREPDLPVIFVNRYPLVREPMRTLRYPAADRDPVPKGGQR